MITPDLIEVINFIKYTKMIIKSDDDILPFYANIYAQALQYIIVLVLCVNITTISCIIHKDLPPETHTVIDTALSTKFREEGIINK